MTIATVLLNIPGSPVPDWLVFLAPLVLLIVIIKTGGWLKQWVRNYVIPKFFTKKKQQEEPTANNEHPYSLNIG
jgi:hypothetical protein